MPRFTVHYMEYAHAWAEVIAPNAEEALAMVRLEAEESGRVPECVQNPERFVEILDEYGDSTGLVDL